MTREARRRGRPKGAKSKAATPAMRIARDCLALIADGVNPTSAAKAVAPNWPATPEETIRRYLYRHIEKASTLLENQWRQEQEREFGHLVTIDDVEAAIGELRSKNKILFDELSADFLNAWETGLAGDEAAIRAYLTKACAKRVNDLVAWARSRADELAREPHELCPPFHHGGVEFLRAFAEALTENN